MKRQYQAVINGSVKINLEVDENHTTTPQMKTLPEENVIHTDFYNRHYRIRIKGAYFDVVLKNELDLLIDEMGLAEAATSSAADLQAPMPGLIAKVLVAEGDEIKKGDPLLILEAMKMENKLTSAVDGIVHSIRVKAGDTVEKGTTLIEFEK